MTKNAETRRARKRDYAKVYYKSNKARIRVYRKGYCRRKKAKLVAYGKAYRKKNRVRIRAYNKTYYERNSAWCSAYGKAYYKRNKDKYKTNRGAYYKAHHKEVNTRARKVRQARKLRVLEAYGRVCQCCREANIGFLTIDHIKNNGAQHRRSLKGGRGSIYQWLVKHSFPPGFQVLCWNCNCGRAYAPDHRCPHKA